ncbi:uncharacterized protein LOC113279419 [Papaver somniferum]|uniref:uncharacterized protein LOC113279419 n=1 Tax=Papaver somniferum TaxID=3469 RepID=UPI000E701D59|nr:uncharacterized protein LOC113279419 [Papaver somniferum]
MISGFHINSDINVTHLQFADVTLIFLDAKEEMVENLVMILQVYESITGLRVNLKKSTVISIGADQKVHEISKILNYKIESLPLKYLGMPFGATMKQTSIWEYVLEKFQKKLAIWKIKFLSRARRIVLINSAPPKRKYAGLLGDRCCLPKDSGGLGIRNIKATNVALLAKWSWRYTQEKHSLWRKIIQLRIRSDKNDIWPKEYNSTYGRGFWKGIQNEKGLVQLNSKFSIGCRIGVKFWLDAWKGAIPFKETHKRAFKATRQKHAKIADLIQQGTWTIQLRENPSPGVLIELNDIFSLIGAPPTLTVLEDSFSYNTNGGYSAKEGYKWQRSNIQTASSFFVQIHLEKTNSSKGTSLCMICNT